MENNKKGIMPGDIEQIKEHELYIRRYMDVPLRFADFILLNKNRPYDREKLINDGYYLGDLQSIINQFNGISYEFLKN